MLLQPGLGTGLLSAYQLPYTPMNPHMNHYNSLLGRINGISFTPNTPTGIANYWDGNTLMSGATGGPVTNLPAGAGQQYGTTQSYMDQLGRMPNQASEIVSPYIYYRPNIDPAALATASDTIQNPPAEQIVQQVSGWGHHGGGGGDNNGGDPSSSSSSMGGHFGGHGNEASQGNPGASASTSPGERGSHH